MLDADDACLLLLLELGGAGDDGLMHEHSVVGEDFLQLGFRVVVELSRRLSTIFRNCL